MSWKDNTIIQFYSRLSHLGIDKNTPQKLSRHILLANSINLTTITLIVPYTFLFYFLGIHKLAILLGSLFFLFSFYHYLTYKKYYFLSRMLMILSMNIALGIYAIVLGRDSGIHFLYFVFFTLPFLLFSLNNYLLIAFCCLSSVVPFCIVRFQLVKPLVELDSLSLQILSVAMILLTFIWLLLNKLYLLKANGIVEENLQQSNQLLQSRNRDLEQFAYVASHDLQEPLRTVASYVELLNKQYNDRFDENGQQYMGFILYSTHRLKKLIKDLLEYSRIGRNYQSEKIKSYTLVQDVVADLKQLIADTQANVVVSPLPDIEGYGTDLKLLFQNLIVNAIKFRKQNELPMIKIWGEELDGFWKFAVSDNGIGIEPQHRERIFVIFQRLHTQAEYDGSGIGLAHCKKIVEMHGGAIWVESELGKGSTFYFTIPI